jgi:hypothetical protein
MTISAHPFYFHFSWFILQLTKFLFGSARQPIRLSARFWPTAPVAFFHRKSVHVAVAVALYPAPSVPLPFGAVLTSKTNEIKATTGRHHLPSSATSAHEHTHLPPLSFLASAHSIHTRISLLSSLFHHRRSSSSPAKSWAPRCCPTPWWGPPRSPLRFKAFAVRFLGWSHWGAQPPVRRVVVPPPGPWWTSVAHHRPGFTGFWARLTGLPIAK